MIKISCLSLLIVFIGVNLDLNYHTSNYFETFQSLQVKEKDGSEIFETKENDLDNIKLKIEFFEINSQKKLTNLTIENSTNSIGVRYELLVPNSIKAKNYRFLSDFTFENFQFKESSINRFKVDIDKYKSEELRSVYIKEGVLYPKNKGTLNIEPVELEMTVDIRTDKKVENGTKDSKTTTVKIASESAQIIWL